jgi:hypothetical protein
LLLLRKANANGGSGVYKLLCLVPYLKRVHFVSQTLAAEYWGSKQHIPMSKAITITQIASYCITHAM